MILLDTNVVSEVMRPSPDARVLEWLDAQPAGEVWITAVTVGEIQLGVALLPEGGRKQRLAEAFAAMVMTDFADACLPYDALAAAEYAEIVAARTRMGRPISVEDAQIAAITRSAGMKLATRNVSDFKGIDRLSIINPWTV